MTARWQVRIATIASFMVVTAFVAGKSARDAMFLSAFDVRLLPTFAAIGAVATLALVLVVSRRMARLGPARLVPLLFAASAVMLGVEWLLDRRCGQVAAAATYFHLGALGPILVSGFWSIVNERFDPRTAKRNIGRIGLGATIGGIAGGLIAQATAAWLPANAILLVVAALQLACIGLLRATGPDRGVPGDDDADVWDGLRVVARGRLLRLMAAVAVLVSIAAAALDYVFKVRIADSGSGALAALGTYYTITNLVTALVQLFVSERLLSRLSPARGIAMLPVILAGGSLLAIAAPVLVAVGRGAEMVARSSIYRAAMELLVAPLASRDKRSAKVLLDVGADRIGDMLGAQLVAVLLLSLPRAIVLSAVVFAGAAAVIACAVPAAYRRVLEDRLIEATPAPVAESVLLPLARESVVAAPHASDAILATIADLRSGDRARVERALAGPLSPEFAAYAIPLVAWAPVAALAATRLRELAPKITGLLIDAVMDPDTDFGVRRRLPALIAVGDPGLAAHGLWRALADARFEVRYRAGRALAQLHDRGAALPTSDDGVFEAIEREVLVDARIWRGYHLLDEAETTPADERLHDVLEQRSLTALDHVFALLGLVLPTEPVRRALDALRSGDTVLRGTALEYLEGVLPPGLRERLWPFLELERQERGDGAVVQTPQQLVGELEASHPSILASLQ